MVAGIVAFIVVSAILFSSVLVWKEIEDSEREKIKYYTKLFVKCSLIVFGVLVLITLVNS